MAAKKSSQELEQRIEAVSAKVRVLVRRLEVESELKRKALEKVSELEAEIERQRQRMKQMDIQIENLQVVSTIVPSKTELDKTHKILSDIVREIDKCIKDLKQ